MIKNKFFVIINVFGLGVALACAIVAYFNFSLNMDFDAVHANKDIIYKVSMIRNIKGETYNYGVTSLALGTVIENSISGIDNVVRFTGAGMAIRYEENIFNKTIGFADTDFFEVFDFPMVSGDENFMTEKSNIIISEKLAKILFGNQDPIGKTITLYNGNKEELLKVSGIFKDIQRNSTMQFDALTGIENFIDLNTIDEPWQKWIAATFLKVPDESRLPDINKQLNRFVEIQNEKIKDRPVEGFYMEPLKDVPHTGPNMRSYWLTPAFSPLFLYFSAILGFIILLLACLNFMNTSLAISSRRLKEIGINKVLGGLRRYTIIQFLGENIILCLIALFFALTIYPFLIDVWISLFPGLALKVDLVGNLRFWVFLLALLLFTSILAGIRPALYISSFSPVKILKGSAKYKAGGWFSKILLVLQFLLATICIVAAIIFTQNAYYLNNFDLGYDYKHIITVPVPDHSKLVALKNKIAQNPLINKIGVSDGHIQWSSYTQVFKSGEQEHEAKVLNVDRGYFEAMGFQLKEGRYFDQGFQESERGKAVIVNEKIVEAYGWENAVGQQLRVNDTTVYKVIGVMKNFNLDAIYFEISPAMLKLGMEEEMDIMVVNADIKNFKKINDAIKMEWEQIILNEPYAGFYQTESYATTKQENKIIIKATLFLGFISIILSLVGLYTLVSLNIIKKTKEIGIRKVYGAPVSKIIQLINREFIYIVLMGSILGAALGALLTFALFNSAYAYHIGFNILSLLIPVLLIVIISIITLSGKVIKAANLNPVESLKYE